MAMDIPRYKDNTPPMPLISDDPWKYSKAVKTPRTYDQDTNRVKYIWGYQLFTETVKIYIHLDQIVWDTRTVRRGIIKSIFLFGNGLQQNVNNKYV